MLVGRLRCSLSLCVRSGLFVVVFCSVVSYCVVVSIAFVCCVLLVVCCLWLYVGRCVFWVACCLFVDGCGSVAR